LQTINGIKTIKFEPDIGKYIYFFKIGISEKIVKEEISKSSPGIPIKKIKYS